MTPTPMVVPLASPVTPVTFQLNGTGELELKCVQATIDGSAAASAFYPVLSIYTQDDKLISRTRTTDTVAAAGSAIVTWAPFLGQAAASSAAGGLTTMFRQGVTGDITCPNAVNTTLTFGTSYVSAGTPFTTADHKTFVLALGIWEITFGLSVNLNFAGNTSTVTSATIFDTAAPIATKQFWLDAIAHNGGTQTFDKTVIVDGSGSAINLNVQLFNFEGANIKVIAAGDLSYLEGVLLKAA